MHAKQKRDDTGRVKIRVGRHLVPIPGFALRRIVDGEAKRMSRTIAFMGPDHHAVRNFSVCEVARTGAPVTAEHIAGAVDLSVNRVVELLEELERKMVFVSRNTNKAVTWAYPVTADVTNHRIEYASAKPTYGA